MTTPQPAALPELPRPFVPGDEFNPRDFYTADQMRAYALAALQSQPAAPGATGAVQTLIETLKADPEYAWAWHCNVAMAAVDEGLSHYAANKAAARFLSWLAQIDTTTHPGFPKAPEQPAAAGVSDAEIDTVIRQKRLAGWFTFSDDLRPFARAILALRPQSESKTYADGTTATGPAPLPDVSPAEQDASLAESLLTDLESMLGGRNGASIKLRSLIRSLRPQAVPITPDQLADKCEAWIQGGGASNIVDAFEAGYRLCEHDHGITAQGAQGEQG